MEVEPVNDLSTKADITLLRNKFKLNKNKNPSKSPSKTLKQNSNQKLTRKSDLSYENLSSEYFLELAPNYNQLFTLYNIRLNQAKPMLIQNCKQKWPNVKITDKILELEGTEQQVIIGTLYKEMVNKPNILHGLESVLGAKRIEDMVSVDSDHLVLEDSSGRVKINQIIDLKGMTVEKLCTGVNVALRGSLHERGFIISDICYYHDEFYQNYQWDLNTNNKNFSLSNILSSSNELVAFISDLGFGCKDYNSKVLSSRTKLLEFFQKKIPNPQIQSLISRINRLIIAGNIVQTPEASAEILRNTYEDIDRDESVYSSVVEVYKEADEYLKYLSSSVNIDIMPGSFDMADSILPKEPLFDFQIPRCHKSVNLVSDPYKFSLGNKSYLGTSGDNINNIKKVTHIADTLEHTLFWGHISPTSGDTLNTYPKMHRDPFFIESLPNVYFAGNQSKFSTKLITLHNTCTRIISVPSFANTLSIVIMDTKTLDTIEYKIGMIGN